MKKILMTGISAGLLVASSAVLALPVIPAGIITFTFSGFDAATTNYPPLNRFGQICGWQANAPASGFNCDSVGPPASNPTPGAMMTPAGPKEDTWGVTRITSLKDQNDNVFWTPGVGDYITAMFYGLYDVGIERGFSTTATYSAAGFLDIYSMPVNPTGIPNPQTRTSFSSFPGYTGTPAQLLLSLQFTTGQALITDGTFAGGGAPFGSTLTGSFNNNSLGGGSNAQLAVDVVGGLWAKNFDTNTIIGENGQKNDLLLSATFRCQSSDPQCKPANTPRQTVFSVKVDGGMDGYYIPEPATISLLSLGLLNLVTFARRRRWQVV